MPSRYDASNGIGLASYDAMQTEKRYKLVPRTNLDLVYVGGVTDSITATPDDVITTTEEGITILIKNEEGKVIERLTCLFRNMLSYRYRDVMRRVEDKSVPPVEPVEVDAPTSD